MAKPTVLIADNHAAYRKSLRHLLEISNFNVEEADSVSAAFDTLERTSACVAVVDVRLTNNAQTADVSGFQVVERAGVLKIPCILVTKYPSAETAAQGYPLKRRYSAADYVFKSDGPRALLNQLQRTIPLVVLHISDLHLGLEDGHVPFQQNRSLDEFQKDLERLKPKHKVGAISAIVVSGDVALKCDPASFGRAEEFLSYLSDKLNVPKQNVVLTPGNHDIDRRRGTSFSKYDQYLQFTRKFYDGAAFAEDHLFKTFVIDNRLAIVAFNSCIAEGDPAYRCPSPNNLLRTGRLVRLLQERLRTDWRAGPSHNLHYQGVIDLNQVEMADEELRPYDPPSMRNEETDSKRLLRIAVCHHHVISAEDESIFERAARAGLCRGDHLNYHWSNLKYAFRDKGFQILLHGHRHKGVIEQPKEVSSELPYTFGSGTLWFTDQSPGCESTYSILYLSPFSEFSKIIVRKYHPDTDRSTGFWGPDQDYGPEGVLPIPAVGLPRYR